MTTYHQLLKAWNWRPIRNCPGRFVLYGAPRNAHVKDIVGLSVPFQELKTSLAKDLVLVTRLDEGGLISYERPDGSFLHTLNDPEGFRRKLAQLGINPSVEGADAVDNVTD